MLKLPYKNLLRLYENNVNRLYDDISMQKEEIAKTAKQLERAEQFHLPVFDRSIGAVVRNATARNLNAKQE